METFPIQISEVADLEHFGYQEKLAAQNKRLLLLVFAFAALLFVMGGALLFATVQIGVRPVHVVRINDVGRAEAVAYMDSNYTPQAREVRYFLAQWARDRYTRQRATVRQMYPQNFYFFDKPIAERLMQADRLDKSDASIEKFMAGSGYESDIAVDNVVVQNLKTAPYLAEIQLTKIVYSAPGQEWRREHWTIPVTFLIQPGRVPNDLVPFNPLGFAITNFGEYQDFRQ